MGSDKTTVRMMLTWHTILIRASLPVYGQSFP